MHLYLIAVRDTSRWPLDIDPGEPVRKGLQDGEMAFIITFHRHRSTASVATLPGIGAAVEDRSILAALIHRLGIRVVRIFHGWKKKSLVEFDISNYPSPSYPDGDPLTLASVIGEWFTEAS